MAGEQTARKQATLEGDRDYDDDDGACEIVSHAEPGLIESLSDGAASLDSDAISESEPPQIVQVAGGSSHSLALDSNGFVYFWGRGAYLPITGHVLLQIILQ